MPNPNTVEVTLDTSVPPTFSFNPPILPIPSGKTTISWVHGHGGASFVFAALAVDHKNPFCNVVVKDTVMTADDDNQHREDHKYSVLVCINHKYYSSKENITTHPGGPTIRNN